MLIFFLHIFLTLSRYASYRKRTPRKCLAMKYMNKTMCIKKDAVRNVLREQEILQSLEPPISGKPLVYLPGWGGYVYVVDLLLGGDLRYHIQQGVKFDGGKSQIVSLWDCLGIGLLTEGIYYTQVSQWNLYELYRVYTKQKSSLVHFIILMMTKD